MRTVQKRPAYLPRLRRNPRILSPLDTDKWLREALTLYLELGDYDVPLRKGEWEPKHKGDKFVASKFFDEARENAYYSEENNRLQLGHNNYTHPKYRLDDPDLYRDQFGRLVETVPKRLRFKQKPGGIYMSLDLFREAWRRTFGSDYYAIDYAEFYANNTNFLMPAQEAAYQERGIPYKHGKDSRQTKAAYEYRHPMDAPFRKMVDSKMVIRASFSDYMVSEEMCRVVGMAKAWTEHRRRYEMWTNIAGNQDNAISRGEKYWKEAFRLLAELPAFDVDHVLVAHRMSGNTSMTPEIAQVGLSRYNKDRTVERKTCARQDREASVSETIIPARCHHVALNLYRTTTANSPGLDGWLNSGPRLAESWGSGVFYRNWLASFLMKQVKATEKNPEHTFTQDDVILAGKRAAGAGLSSDKPGSIMAKFRSYLEAGRAKKKEVLFQTVPGGGYRVHPDMVKRLNSNRRASKVDEDAFLRSTLLDWLEPLQMRSPDPFYIMYDDAFAVAPGVVAGEVMWSYIKRSGLFYRMFMLPDFMMEHYHIPERLKLGYYPTADTYRAMNLHPPQEDMGAWEFLRRANPDGMDLAPFRIKVPWNTKHLDELDRELGRTLG